MDFKDVVLDSPIGFIDPLLEHYPVFDNDWEAIASNPNVDVLASPLQSDILNAEYILRITFPPLIRQWIENLGSWQILPDVADDPKLLLLGISPESSIDDSIILFNNSDNPSRPAGYLVFAHEFDGESDIVYALRPDSSVASVKNKFAFPYYRHQDCYTLRDAAWQTAFESLQDFWDGKVQPYLELSRSGSICP